MKKKTLLAPILLLCLLLCACAETKPSPLPKPEVDASTEFGVDKNINMTTIDGYLGRDDVYYRDVRMLFDPADFAAVGGEADLTRTIRGFRIVPYPYLGTLQGLPVDGAYRGESLYTVEWGADGHVVSATANYRESEQILRELFPRDGKAIFLMCGGGGYAGMTKELLLYLGWDADTLYNIGANWTYSGENRLELVVYPEEAGDAPIYATWRADYALIDFERLERMP